jgi:hypothetical protein
MVASVRDGLAIAWAKCVGDGMVSNADVAGSAWSTVAVLGAVGRRAAGKPGYGSALGQQALGATVYAEIDPSQKERIIRALRRDGSVVGYLGDGINDAPALQPVSKRPGCLSPGATLGERDNCAYMGTSVRSGWARAVVDADAAGPVAHARGTARSQDHPAGRPPGDVIGGTACAFSTLIHVNNAGCLQPQHGASQARRHCHDPRSVGAAHRLARG